MSTPKLKRALTRKLEATDRSRRARPFFVRVHPEGIIEVWPRRLKPASLHVIDCYIHAVNIAKEKAKMAKRKTPFRVKRGML